jgi:hypothetical protein
MLASVEATLCLWRSYMRFNNQAWWNYRNGNGPKPDAPNSLGYHERKCTVCEHPDREAIEEEFLRWYSPEHIAEDHDLPRPSAIYRHARALGLFERRRKMVRFALEPLIEQANLVPANASTVIRAIRTYARLDNRGHLLDRAPDSSVNRRRSSKSKCGFSRHGK